MSLVFLIFYRYNFYLPDSLLPIALNFIGVFILLFIIVGFWCYDLFLTSSFGFIPLQLNSALVLSFILFISTEILLFFSLFLFHFNSRFFISFYYYISYPSLFISSIYCFGLPFSNLLILLYSSFPLQCSILYLKSGNSRFTIMSSLSQLYSTSILFLSLQIIEFIFSFSSISDSSISSIFYFITSIHGFHVGFGAMVLSFYFLLFNSSL